MLKQHQDMEKNANFMCITKVPRGNMQPCGPNKKTKCPFLISLFITGEIDQY